MNDDTKFILRQMAVLEARMMTEFKELHAWKNKAIGVISVISIVFGALGSIIIEIAAKHL